MNSKFSKYLFYYLIFLFICSCVYLAQKHNVGNDSTISEWLINYEGGFTKRGIIGQINIYLANLFNIELRKSILFFQIVLIGVYFILLFRFVRSLRINKILLLSIFTPIFIIYPLAEVEVLARKEVFLFCIFIIYLNLNSFFSQNVFKIIFLSLAILIHESVIFYFLFFIGVDVIKNSFNKLNRKILLSLFSYSPATFVALYIALNPLNAIEHQMMSDYLKNNFNEVCYMSCALLKTKSSIHDQFLGNNYSVEVFVRYFLIILIGFGPLLLLLKHSYILNKQLIFFKFFNNLLTPFLLFYIPVFFFFAMGSDWGRYVNISYVFGILLYLFLYKENFIKIDDQIFNRKIISPLKNNKIFIIFFIIFCFGWNQKTAMTGDIATNPLWKVPYNASKIIFGFSSFRILQDSPISIWHKKYIE
jgi:hypothetical protein